MPYSYTEWTVSKSEDDTIAVSFPYLEQDHVYVMVDGSDVSSSLYTWTTDSLITCLAGFPSGTTLRVERRTPTEELPSEQSGAGVFDWSGANTNDLSALYIQQEYIDGEAARDAAIATVEDTLDGLADDVAAAASSASAASSSADEAAASAAAAATFDPDNFLDKTTYETKVNSAYGWGDHGAAGYLTSAAFAASIGVSVQAHGDALDSVKDTAWVAGDLAYGSDVDTLTRLPKGTDGQFLELDSGLPAWKGAVSASTNGYVTLPSGIIIQWGSVTCPDDSNQAVSFPLTFPTACLSAQASLGFEFNTGVDAGCGVNSLTASGMNVRSGANVNGTVYWLAIGH